MTGTRFDAGQPWTAWVEAHRSSLPPQLDPETIGVGPVVVPRG